ncbi:hypothetical protein LTR95_011756 [Oleoguttula sp. CCFEE 5521]
MALPNLFRLPRPKSVLHFISLKSATELVFLTLCFNRLAGLYGMLALFTGYALNPLQLSQYIYSLLTLALIVYLSSAFRTTDQPLKTLGLAWLFVIDSAVNLAYTVLFGVGWFIVLAQHLNDKVLPGSAQALGAETIDQTAGFTDPEVNATKVDVVASPAPGLQAGQDAIAVPTTTPGTLTGAVFASGSMASITVIGVLWIIRLYFILIVLSYARTSIRSYILQTSTTYTHSEDPSLAENPFRPGREEGAGWKGKLGRLMLRFPSQQYWLGRDENEEEWVRSTSGRFEGGRGLRIKVPDGGIGERERRARSGTGPPKPVVVPALGGKVEKGSES